MPPRGIRNGADFALARTKTVRSRDYSKNKKRRPCASASGCRKSPTDFFDAFTIPRFSGRSAARKSAAARRKRLLAQAFCRHLIPHEGAPAPSYSPCKMQPSCFKQWFFDSLRPGRSSRPQYHQFTHSKGIGALIFIPQGCSV